MTPLQILTEPITVAQLTALAEEGYGDMVKAVVGVYFLAFAIAARR